MDAACATTLRRCVAGCPTPSFSRVVAQLQRPWPLHAAAAAPLAAALLAATTVSCQTPRACTPPLVPQLRPLLPAAQHLHEVTGPHQRAAGLMQQAPVERGGGGPNTS